MKRININENGINIVFDIEDNKADALFGSAVQ